MDIIWVVVFVIAVSICSYLLGSYTGKIKERTRKEEKKKARRNLIGKTFTLDPKEKEIDLYSDEKLMKNLCPARGGAKALIVGSFREKPDDEYYLSYEIETMSLGQKVTGWIPSFFVDEEKIK